jgi:acetyl-CoA carboxylase biotin carboxyl carrier protein
VDIDFDQLGAMVELLKDTDFSEFVYEKGDLRIVVIRGDGAGQRAPRVVRREVASAHDGSAPREPSPTSSEGRETDESGGPAGDAVDDGVRLPSCRSATWSPRTRSSASSRS